jgi:hypothetical protein
MRRIERDARACIESPYLTPAEQVALSIRREHPQRPTAAIGRSLAMTEDLVADVLASAQRKLANDAPEGTDSRRSRRMARNQLRWARRLDAERCRRGLPSVLPK